MSYAAAPRPWLTEDETQIWKGYQSHRTKSAHNDKILEFRVGMDSTPASVLAGEGVKITPDKLTPLLAEVQTLTQTVMKAWKNDKCKDYDYKNHRFEHTGLCVRLILLELLRKGRRKRVVIDAVHDSWVPTLNRVDASTLPPPCPP